MILNTQLSSALGHSRGSSMASWQKYIACFLMLFGSTLVRGQVASDILPDLQYFKVTFPVDANGNDNRNVSYSSRSSNYVKAAEETDLVGYSPANVYASYFFVSGSEVVFKAHCAGALTSANAYPRTELRETPNGTNDLWSFSDEHVLNSTFRVTHLPDQKQEVCMLQIKGNSSNSTSNTQEAFRLEYRQDGSQGLHVVINEGSTQNDIMPYSLGQTLETRMYVNNGRVYIDLKNASTGNTWSTDFASNYSYGYFKAGCYTQSSMWEEKNGVAPEDPDAYGEVRFSKLSLSDDVNPPAGCTATVPSGRSTSNIAQTSVTLSWNAVANIDHYNVRYRPTGSSTWLFQYSLQTNTTNVSGLSAGTTYEWQVRAKCADNTGSSYSSGAGPQFTTTSPSTTCTASTPSNRSAGNVTSNSVTLSWNAIANIDHYNVRYRPTGSSTWAYQTSLQTNSASVSGLSSGTTYEWQVRAKCASGSASSYSSGAGPTFTTSSATLSCTDNSNLATGKSLSNISAQQSNNPASNIVDGNMNNRWSAQGYPQSVVIDLGGVYAVDHVKLYPYGDRAYQFLVEGSTSSSTSGFSTMTDARSNTSGGSVITKNFSAKAARYVKLTITGASGYSGGWSSVEEFAIICAGSGTQRTGRVLSEDESTEEWQPSYPNPFDSEFTVTIPRKSKGSSSIRLVDMLGRVVFAKSSLQAGEVITVTTGTNPSGVYLLQWINEEQQTVHVEKVIRR